MYLEVGAKAPAFTLKNQNGESVSLKEFAGKYVVLYFYPRALTPGCTTQACGITSHQKEFSKRKVVVLGVSGDEVEKLKRFEEKKELDLILLSDPEHKVCNSYKIYGLKKFMGKESMGILRTTYLIDPAGKIIHVMKKVKTATHNDDILQIIDEIRSK